MRAPPPRLIRSTVAALLIAAVAFVYRQAAFAYFMEDDFHWLGEGHRFEWVNLVHLERYSHFYRPVIEIYFFLGQRLFGCAALPYHLASLCIHLLNTIVLFLFARRLTDSRRFAVLAVVLFVVQPGYVQAVAWVAAITDLLPATWYLLTLLLHLLFLQTGRRSAYAAALATFIACLLTHESAATLLPMMIALEILLLFQESHGRARSPLAAQLARYAPFAVLLVLFLIVAYVVNSRSYPVREGYYAFGPHAFRNAFHYVVALYVGKRTLMDYALIAAAAGAVMFRGTPRMRFFVLWIFVAQLPVLFFTWGIASRYLYVPAAGFALFLADLLMASETIAARWMPAHATRTVTAVVAIALSIRFAAFAQEGSEGFHAATLPSQRLVGAIRAASPSLPPDRVVHVDRRIAEPVPEIYRDAVAETAFCTAGVRLILR